ncbi:MAG: 2-iminoacetate synthase ThiH [Deltaproteobacteria bacterium]|nr:2-iminoacetate synthase ThiH [Deltaproteobacteria bacterium]
MSFYDTITRFEAFDFDGFFNSVTDRDVERALSTDRLTWQDFLALLSERAVKYLEPMAQKARQLTIQYFGRTIQLYIPLYIANYCSNECIYCGFNRTNKINRKKLTLDEIEMEAEAISQTEMKHILVLTGEAPKVTPIEYIEEAITILKKWFSSISIEIFPMDTDGYRRLKTAGVDGLTIYQEVYDRRIYDKVHLAGGKTDYRYRLDAPERGARSGLRNVNVGALFGLGEKRSEAFLAGMHAKYLEDHYLDTEIGLSLPRINPAEGGFQPYDLVDDRTFVQFMVAYRLFLPRAGIAISTRECAEFRDRLLFLGATRYSAGSRTDVGGYAHPQEASTAQFEISDERGVEKTISAIREKGFQPVFKDWELIA